MEAEWNDADKPWLKEYVCVICGKHFYKSVSRQVKYCSDRCRDTARQLRKIEAPPRVVTEEEKARRREREQQLAKMRSEYPDMTQGYFSKHKDAIAHQRDTEVWTHDYAERQKQKTLAMIGGIEIDL